MKKRLILLLAFLAMSAWAAIVSLHPQENTWLLIGAGGDFSPGIYINTNPARAELGSSFRSVEFLIEYPTARDVRIGDRVVRALSMVRMMIVDCDTGMHGPLSDYYFSIRQPQPNTRPVGRIDYDTMNMLLQAEKRSDLYKTLCPISV